VDCSARRENGPVVVTDDPRTLELAQNLADVRARLASACAAAGRDPGEVTLVAVTKTFPAADVVRLVELGVADIGENRDQEAAPKAAEAAAAGAHPRWHFIGQLQRNKARSVVTYAGMVHSVDSVRLVDALEHAVVAHRDGRPLEVLVQVSLDGVPGRGGALVDSTDDEVDLAVVLAQVSGAAHLVLRGLMAVAPLDEDPEPAFAQLAAVAADTRRTYPDATLLSAGMSSDVEQAIRYGATHVRLGHAVLGNRIPLL
jgi:pyridoxal phosphate enzyme (YggS family)